MPKYYSLDLREKVMQNYKASQRKRVTCEIYKIARTTLDHWIALEENTGSLQQPALVNVGRPRAIKDIPAFESFVKRTSFTQAKDLVPLFSQEFGYSVDYPVILRALKQMGWTLKKRPSATVKHAK